MQEFAPSATLVAAKFLLRRCHDATSNCLTCLSSTCITVAAWTGRRSLAECCGRVCVSLVGACTIHVCTARSQQALHLVMFVRGMQQSAHTLLVHSLYSFACIARATSIHTMIDRRLQHNTHHHRMISAINSYCVAHCQEAFMRWEAEGCSRETIIEVRFLYIFPTARLSYRNTISAVQRRVIDLCHYQFSAEL